MILVLMLLACIASSYSLSVVSFESSSLSSPFSSEYAYGSKNITYSESSFWSISYIAFKSSSIYSLIGNLSFVSGMKISNETIRDQNWFFNFSRIDHFNCCCSSSLGWSYTSVSSWFSHDHISSNVACLLIFIV